MPERGRGCPLLPEQQGPRTQGLHLDCGQKLFSEEPERAVDGLQSDQLSTVEPDWSPSFPSAVPSSLLRSPGLSTHLWCLPGQWVEYQILALQPGCKVTLGLNEHSERG